MPRASHPALLWLTLAATLAHADPLIRDKREVPLDPLEGIPEEAPSTGKPRPQAKLCRLSVSPADDRDIADLRATLAVIQGGPKSVPCPFDLSLLRLRLTIDARGRVTTVERLAGDNKLGDSLARILLGQLCQSTVATPTKGVAQINLRRGK